MGTQKRHISHQQFFSVCEELRNRQEEIVKTCFTVTAVAEYLTPRLGFDVPIGSVETALKATKISLESRRSRPIEDRKLNTTRIVCKALLYLFNALGEAAPEDLVEMHRRAGNGKEPSKNGQAPSPVLIENVPDPKTIKIAN